MTFSNSEMTASGPDMVIVLDPEADHLSDEEYQPVNDVWKPTPQQLSDLKLAHSNCGHPSNAEFAKLLKLGNARQEVWQWVRHNFKCEECEAEARPKAKRH